MVKQMEDVEPLMKNGVQIGTVSGKPGSRLVIISDRNEIHNMLRLTPEQAARIRALDDYQRPFPKWWYF